jgi:uncharacterized Zn-binding protein involved in type VI secretion
MPLRLLGVFMAAKPIIRLGDQTSHGGVVAEGFPDFMIHGKNVAGVGHKVTCPLCPGSHVIVAGAANVSAFGKNIALEGMQTSCGAVLIPSQGTATVNVSSGAAGGDSAAKGAASVAASVKPVFDEQFLLQDANGTPLSGVWYTAKLPTGDLVHGVTDDDGKTDRYTTESAQTIKIYFGHRESV